MSTVTDHAVDARAAQRHGGSLPGWVAGVIVACHLPLVGLHFARLWRDVHYQFFPVVLMAFVLLVRRPARRRRGGDEPKRQEVVSWLAGGLLLLAAAVYLWSPWLAAVAAIVTSRGLLIGWLGRPFTGPWLLLWLLVPLPLGWDRQLLIQLQLASTEMGSLLLDSLGVRHLLAGNLVELPQRIYFEERAMLGAAGVTWAVALTAVFVVWMRRPLTSAVLLIASAAGWAVLANALYVVAVVGWQLAGWQVGAVSWALAGFAAMMILSTDRLLAAVFQPRPGSAAFYAYQSYHSHYRQPTAAGSQNVAPVSEPAAVSLRESIRSLPGAVLGICSGFMVLALLQLPVLATDAVAGTAGRPGPVAASLRSELSAADLGSWQRTDRTDDGETEVVWTFRDEDGLLQARFVLDVDSELDVDQRYEVRGWEVVQAAEQATGDDAAGLPPSVQRYELYKPSGEVGYLVATWLDADGRVVSSGPERFDLRLLAGHRPVVVRRLAVLATGYDEVTAAQRVAVERLFLGALK